MKNYIIIAVLVVVVGIGGFFVGQNGASSGVDTKKLEDSIKMMKEQDASIKAMGEMMKSGSAMMVEAGTKYKDEALMNSGKDMEAVMEKYSKTEDSKAAGGETMNKLMN